MAHRDSSADQARVAVMPPGKTGLPACVDNFVRFSKGPTVTIASIRERVRGASNKFVLASKRMPRRALPSRP